MKVLLVNGSPKKNGCTYTALCEVEKSLNKNGIETEIFHIGNAAIEGCRACSGCRKLNKCVINDVVNIFAEKAKDADGFVFGSPVYYAGASGQLTAFMDRLFYSGKAHLQNKPACAVVSCRRGGASSAFENINKYFMISNMPVVSSQYWNQVHGNTPEEVAKDLEGLQTLRTLGDNMAWLIKSIKIANLPVPEREVPIRTNFIS